ncbi:MAG TPA: translocation/assembly module TamB domain-containing protein [Bacteroidota bacterium]|nr:translocation/assembly module TamB domain-containing protein [Bacteroidota bacterium]
MRKLRTIALYLLIGIPVFIGVLIAITQTQIFRERLRSAALSELDSLINGTVTIGRLNGDLITGMAIDSVAIDVDGGPFVRIPRLEIAYNFLALPGKTIAIRRLTLVRPEITFSRPRTGRWNLSDLLRRRPADTSASKPFDWVIDVERLEVLDGTVSLLDSMALAGEDHPEVRKGFVEYHAFTLRNVNLVLGANIRSDRQRAVISSCSFASASPVFNLRMLCGVFTLSRSEARVDSMRVITGKTNLWLDASMKDIDLLGGIELRNLKNAPVELSLRARPIDLGELQAFLDPLAFSSGTPEIALQASGPFGDLAVNKLDMRFGSSALYLKGAVTNLHEPRKLALNVKVTESTVVGTDVEALLPGLDIPDLSPLGTSTLNLEYEGTPAEFRTKFLLETAAGKVQSSGLRLSVGGPSKLGYDGTILFRNMNLGRALADDRLRSNLNGSVVVRGKGVTLRGLASTMELEVDTSSFRGLPLTETRVALQGEGGRLGGRMNVSLGDMQARLSGDMQQAPGRDPAFHLEGDVSSLNLESILHDTSFNSDITMKLNAQGSGHSLASLGGEVTADLSSSRYRDYTLDQGIVHLVLDQKDSTRKNLQVESNIADLSLTGAFDIRYLVNLARFESANLRSAIADRIALIQPRLAAGIDRQALAASARPLLVEPHRIDAHYVLDVKDLEPLSAAAGSTSFDGKGSFSGTIRGGYGGLSLTTDGVLDDFFYGKADSGVLIEGGRVRLNVSSLGSTSPLKGASVRLEAGAAKVHVNRNSLDSLDVRFSYGREQATFGAGAIVNTDYRVSSAGTAKVDDISVSVIPSALDVAYRDFRWRADSGAVFRVNHVGAGVSGLVFRRDSQSVAVNLTLGQGETVKASVDGKNLDLEGLKHLLGGEEAPGEPKTFTGTARLKATAAGTLADPEMSATIEADSVTFRALPFGRLVSDLRYRDRSIEGHVRVVEPGKPADTSPIMTIDGTLPVDLRLEKSGEDTAGREMNLRVLSHGVQMNILEPLLHTFKDLSGLMTSDLTLTGTLKDPVYAGTLGISQCSFLFLPNNIRYTLEGTFRPQGERINVVDCVIKNVPEDVRAGREGIMHLGGDFSLRNLRPGDFNLTADGRLLVVKETTEQSSLGVYGDLFVEIGPGPLHFTGEIENSLLRGSVGIGNSSLIFPPTQSTVVEESPQSVRLLFVNDTLRVEKKPERSAVARYFAGTFDGPAAAGAGERKSKSFMDGLHYDLDITAGGGNTEIRMIFNPVTNEELVAVLDGKFTITGDGRRWTGDLTINRAYYNFIKRFDATGSISYTGDFLNPALNIVATYQGTRTVRDTTAGSTTPQRSERILVTLKISGTRKEPKVEFGMTINDVDYALYSGQTSHDLQSDCIAFILVGNFPMNADQRNELPTQAQSMALTTTLSGASSVLTGKMSEFLKHQAGLDVNVELNNVAGKDAAGRDATELRLSGTAWNGYWRYGGTILNDPLANANVSILYSLGTVFDAPSLRNLMLELERRVEPAVITNDLKRINSARLFYRFSF